MHGPTFMGNPIACAAANASLDLFDEEPRLGQVKAIEEKLSQRLSVAINWEDVHSVNCRGAVGAIRFKTELDVAELSNLFAEQGAWIRPIRDTVYLAPAFTISNAELDLLCDAIESLAD